MLLLDSPLLRALLVLPLHPNGRFLDSEEVHGVMQQQFCSICRGPGSLLGKLAAEFPAGQEKRAKFSTSKAPLSADFHSFRLIFGRAIISGNGLEA